MNIEHKEHIPSPQYNHSSLVVLLVSKTSQEQPEGIADPSCQ